MKTNMHDNSLKAHAEEKTKLGKRAAAIFAHMKAVGSPETDREIMSALGFTEPNAVRPRITELIRIGLVKEVGNVKCRMTGKTVRQVRVVGHDQLEMF